MLLVGTSEEILTSNIDLFITEDIPNVYFSTLKRLESLPFNEDFTQIHPSKKITN